LGIRILTSVGNGHCLPRGTWSAPITFYLSPFWNFA